LRTLAYRVAALVGLVTFLVGRHPQAQSPSPEELAQRHHERGTVYYNLGQFEEAIGEYRKGYEQKADPVFLFDIAQSYGQLGAQDRALFFYRRYLAAAPAATNRAEVEQRIAALAPAPPPQARPDLFAVAPPPPVAPKGERPMWHKWWFWAGAGGLILGGVAAGFAVSRGDTRTGELGNARFF
jgi:tetratricopeptide (TPR) repeat protein